MSDAPNPPTQDEEPAEGSRETITEAQAQAEADKGTTEAQPERQSDG